MQNLPLLALYVVGFIAIFYFLAIRPQRKQRQTHESLIGSVKKADRIVTVGGLFGTVRRVDESTLMVEVAKGVQIQIARRAIAEIIVDPKAAKPATPEPADAKSIAASTGTEPEEDSDGDAS